MNNLLCVWITTTICDWSMVSSGSCINQNMLFHSAAFKTKDTASKLSSLDIHLVKVFQKADDVGLQNGTTPLHYTLCLQEFLGLPFAHFDYSLGNQKSYTYFLLPLYNFPWGCNFETSALKAHSLKSELGLASRANPVLFSFAITYNNNQEIEYLFIFLISSHILMHEMKQVPRSYIHL